MKFFTIFFLISVVLVLGSCQNRNLVTHNKRKYPKGYYNSKHKNLKNKATRNNLAENKISPEITTNDRDETGVVQSEQNHFLIFKSYY